ncbi:unnamed protein product [Urochloa decumbens]|uniref:Digalactosyldiacylglycerol synthase n=1 Tax=Urochloa decumbens TaxID=240449 RepID=A0ABC9G264_9POAL
MSSRKHFAIFTTASLPWMTGTAINPLFRAAYLAKHGNLDVTLVLPWLNARDQVLAYPDNNTFDSPETQAWYVRMWVEERIDFGTSFRIIFYKAEFSKETGRIHPVGDITRYIKRECADIALLEEPQHLLQEKYGQGFKKMFKQVIGIIDTDYVTPRFPMFPMFGNTWATQCHKMFILPGATQNLTRSVVCNVNGVDKKFLEVGKTKLTQLQSGENAFPNGAYYIGNMRIKEYKEFFSLLSKNQRNLFHLQMDLYVCGSEDYNAVHKAARRSGLAINVYPGRDHSDPLFHDYKVFINPSTTNAACGTATEALAMGKIIICPNRPSNEFFKNFPNCHTYDNVEELVQLTLNALSEQPHPFQHMQDELTWEAATKRFAVAAGIKPLSDQLAPFIQLANMQRYNKQSWKTPTKRFI